MKRYCLGLFFPAVLNLYSCGTEQPYREHRHNPTGFDQATRELFSLVAGRTIRARVSTLFGDRFLAAQALLTRGADINARDGKGRTLLHWVRDAKMAKFLVEYGADPNITDNRGVTPLHLVKKPEIAMVLIDAKADVNAKDSDGDTPLHGATYQRDYTLALVFLQFGADVRAENKSGETPLNLAELRVNEASSRRIMLLSDVYELRRAKEMKRMYLKVKQLKKDYREGYEAGKAKAYKETQSND